MKQLLSILMVVVCILFVFAACGNKTIKNNGEERTVKNDDTVNVVDDIFDNNDKNNIDDISLDYHSIAEEATLQYESATDEWRYTVYKDNTGVYDCYVVLWDYLKDIPEHIDLPAEIDGYPVIAIFGYEDAINSSIFEKQTRGWGDDILKSVSFPDSFIYIGKGAFCYSKALADIKWSQNITRIEDCAFRDCYELNAPNLPTKLKYVSWQAFKSCGFTELVIPDALTHISDGAFDIYKLEEVTIPKTVTYIGERAFSGKTVIYGHIGSEAARYAAEENKVFKPIN